MKLNNLKSMICTNNNLDLIKVKEIFLETVSDDPWSWLLFNLILSKKYISPDMKEVEFTSSEFANIINVPVDQLIYSDFLSMLNEVAMMSFCYEYNIGEPGEGKNFESTMFIQNYSFINDIILVKFSDLFYILIQEIA